MPLTHLVYEDNPLRGGGAYTVPYHRQNATAQYLKHYANSLYLGFMIQNGNMEERHRASKELTICDRKMKYWQHHPNYRQETILAEVPKLKAQWGK